MKLIGSVRLRPCFIALYMAIAFPSWSAAVAASDSTPGELDRQIPFALAVRGGVSLGSYEAGFNWALLQYMKNLRIDNRTGADSYIELKATSGAAASFNLRETESHSGLFKGVFQIGYADEEKDGHPRASLPDEKVHRNRFST